MEKINEDVWLCITYNKKLVGAKKTFKTRSVK